MAKEAKVHNTKKKRRNGNRNEAGGAGGYGMSKSSHSYSDGFGTPYNVMLKKAIDFNKGKMPKWFNRLSQHDIDRLINQVTFREYNYQSWLTQMLMPFSHKSREVRIP